jgi:hypothetical protein
MGQSSGNEIYCQLEQCFRIELRLLCCSSDPLEDKNNNTKAKIFPSVGERKKKCLKRREKKRRRREEKLDNFLHSFSLAASKQQKNLQKRRKQNNISAERVVLIYFMAL